MIAESLACPKEECGNKKKLSARCMQRQNNRKIVDTENTPYTSGYQGRSRVKIGTSFGEVITFQGMPAGAAGSKAASRAASHSLLCRWAGLMHRDWVAGQALRGQRPPSVRLEAGLLAGFGPTALVPALLLRWAHRHRLLYLLRVMAVQLHELLHVARSEQLIEEGSLQSRVQYWRVRHRERDSTRSARLLAGIRCASTAA